MQKWHPNIAHSRSLALALSRRPSSLRSGDCGADLGVARGCSGELHYDRPAMSEEGRMTDEMKLRKRAMTDEMKLRKRANLGGECLSNLGLPKTRSLTCFSLKIWPRRICAKIYPKNLTGFLKSMLLIPKHSIIVCPSPKTTLITHFFGQACLQYYTWLTPGTICMF